LIKTKTIKSFHKKGGRRVFQGGGGGGEEEEEEEENSKFEKRAGFLFSSDVSIIRL
jgi:hypothetical protein